MPIWANALLTHHADLIYPIIFLLLLGAGLGLPVSADLVLLTAGYLAYAGSAQVSLLIPLAISAILLSDGLMYLVGSRVGLPLTQRWPLRGVLTPKRIHSARLSFNRRGYWIVFLARFMPGIRTVFMFTSGLMNLNFRRFILYDAAGALIAVPISILSVRWVAGNTEVLRPYFQRVQGGVLLIAVIGLIVGLIFRRRNLKASVETE